MEFLELYSLHVHSDTLAYFLLETPSDAAFRLRDISTNPDDEMSVRKRPMLAFTLATGTVYLMPLRKNTSARRTARFQVNKMEPSRRKCGWIWSAPPSERRAEQSISTTYVSNTQQTSFQSEAFQSDSDKF